MNEEILAVLKEIRDELKKITDRAQILSQVNDSKMTKADEIMGQTMKILEKALNHGQ